MARFASAVEGHLFDAIVPNRDARALLLDHARPSDRARDQLLRTAILCCRDGLEDSRMSADAKRALRRIMPLLEEADATDARIDVLCFSQVPLLEEQVNDACHAGVAICEGLLTDG